MLDMLASGMSAREVAYKLNLTCKAVWRRMAYWKVEKHLPTGGQRGARNGHWRGGHRLSSDGYMMILCPEHPYKDSGGYVFEHRLVMEEKLGRYLTEKEVVHHKNYNKTDNRIENLDLFPNQKAHAAWHIRNDPLLRARDEELNNIPF